MRSRKRPLSKAINSVVDDRAKLTPLQGWVSFKRFSTTIEDAARKAGASPSLVRHVIATKLIRAEVAELTSGRKLHVLHRDDVTRFAELAATSLNLGQAAISLSVSERMVCELIEENVLKPVVSRKREKQRLGQYR